jgi:hypothetical protein
MRFKKITLMCLISTNHIVTRVTYNKKKNKKIKAKIEGYQEAWQNQNFCVRVRTYVNK